MDYNKLTIKKQLLGKTLNTGVKSILLSDDLPFKDKVYLYNLVTKDIFDYNSSNDYTIDTEVILPKSKNTVKVINVKNVTKRAGRPKGSKNKK